jgi:hypothetical protein
VAATRSLLALLLVWSWGGALRAGTPEEFVRTAENVFAEAGRPAQPDARAAACARLVADGFDLASLAATAAGQFRNALGPELDRKMIDAVATHMTTECTTLRFDVAAGTATIIRTRETDFGIKIITQYPGPENEAGQVLVWSLRTGGPWGYRAVDLSVDGSSLALTLRDTFDAAVLAHAGDLGAAIADLQSGGRK